MNKEKKLSRKEELEKQLEAIENKEMAEKLEELKHIDSSLDAKIRLKKEELHEDAIKTDLFIKGFIAFFTGAAFLFTIYHGVQHGHVGAKASVHFQMLSVLGPLFGAVLQYYFGKSKAGANGE